MNKSKIILASVGGTIGVAVLVMGYLVWTSFAAKTAAIEGDEDGNDGLETVEENASRLSKKEIYPCAASVKAVESNEAAVVAWKDEAFKLAARGDRPVKPTTTAQFKSDMVDEAKRLLALPGAVQGLIAKPDFAFGPFKEYIAEGKMPSEGKLAQLQRQWGDVVLMVETLAKCGIAELVDVQLKENVEQKEEQAPRKVKTVKKAKKDAEIEPTLQPSAQTYVLTFMTKPQGFVKCLNAFETSERFIVVESFGFVRDKDVIQTALGGDEKKDAAQQTGGRRRNRRDGAMHENKKSENEEKPKNGIITDPLLDAPFKVELTISTYDFKTLEEAAKEEDKK